MSTRGAVGFRLNGTDKITYNHSDSYPSGLGQEVLDFLRSYLKKSTIEGLQRRVAKIEMVASDSTPTPEQQKKYSKFANTEVSTGQLKEWYVLLRGIQGDIKSYLKAGVMINGASFLNDSLFCEWAYIINLDDKTLEVYKGFNEAPGGDGRYAKDAVLPPARADGYQYKYYPVQLVKTYKLNRLPKTMSRLE